MHTSVLRIVQFALIYREKSMREWVRHDTTWQEEVKTILHTFVAFSIMKGRLCLLNDGIIRYYLFPISLSLSLSFVAFK